MAGPYATKVPALSGRMTIVSWSMVLGIARPTISRHDDTPRSLVAITQDEF
jgi:hypothetical protein